MSWPAIVCVVAFAWLPSVWLTHKYVHKYPRRYDTYLFASHFKAAIVMTFFLLVIRLVAGSEFAPLDSLFASLVLFSMADVLISLPRVRRQPKASQDSATKASATVPEEQTEFVLQSVSTKNILEQLAGRMDFEPGLLDFLKQKLPGSDTGIAFYRVLDDIPEKPERSPSTPDEVGLLIGATSINRVRRLNLFVQYCVKNIAMGGYLVVKYTPLSTVNESLRKKRSGFLFPISFFFHFVLYRAIPKIPFLDKLYFSRPFAWLDKYFLRKTKWRTRDLSTAEVWGRLAYYGMEVRAESESEANRFVLAQRVAYPVTNKAPSYYAVIALEKVGLDGEPIRLHKVRSMYPFSEFLQAKIYESHGLSPTGKFKNDFRLTEYGKIIRSYWLDELPGLFDWLRGDIKLVGMRATSPHFLSLYPQEVYDLYVQVKPGLIPPIFDESTGGFDKIVEVELAYLRRYLQAPIKTDIQYFWYTFRDIVFRKVRSH